MKWLAFALCAVVVWLAARWLVERLSPPPDTLGDAERPLSVCPGSPNCVSSLDAPPTIAPLQSASAQALFEELTRRVAADSRATILTRNETYLHAEYRSVVFGFIDDLELRLDKSAQRIDLRSASRLGHSDFGVNRKRLMALTADLNIAGELTAD